MGLIKEITDVSELKDIPVNDKFYEMIDNWKQIYQGYYPEWHDIRYHTIDGPKTRTMATMNMAKVVSQEMSSLIFNEECEISISDPDFSEFVEGVLEDNRFYFKFQSYLEYMFGTSGMVLKPYVENDKIKISYVTADCFIPISWDNKGIFEAAFLFQTRKGKKHYTHLEIHQKVDNGYLIKNELYESEIGGKLGHKVPISILYPDLDPEVLIENLDRPLFVYFRPNIANNFEFNSPLGVPLYINAIDTLKALDVAFDSFQREFKLGKKRIIVPASSVRTIADENGGMVRYFDSSDEVYQAFAYGDLEKQKIYDNTVEIRVEEHIKAINSLLNILAMQTGFSTGAFTFDGQSVKTATEVVSENSKTFKSKQSHEIIIEDGIKELISIIGDLADLYNLYSTPQDYEVSVKFDDSIAEDENAEIDKQIKLLTNRLTSQKRAIMKVHRVTEEEAEEIIREILAETRQASPDLEELKAEGALFGEEE